MGEHIRIHVELNSEDGPAGETLWATKSSEFTAIIDNIPFFADDVCLGDKVMIHRDDEGMYKFVKVLDRHSRRFLFQYKTGRSKEQCRKNWIKIVKRFEKLNFKCEGAAPGVGAVAYKIEEQEACEDALNECSLVIDYGE